MAEIHRVVGMGSDQLLDAVLSADRDKGSDPSIIAAHAALYGACWCRVRPLPGAAQLLRACRDAGLQVVLASSADPKEFAALCAALDADDAIDAAISAGDVDRSKPAPDIVETALRKAGVTAGEAVFVGDTIWDVRASLRCGVSCIGLLSGGSPATELSEAGAVAVFSDPAQLLHETRGHLDRVLAQRQPPGD